MVDLSTVVTSAITTTVVGAVVAASLKRRVDAYVETLKHDLQREALKAELSTKQKHVIYPRLAAKLRRAESAFGGLVGSWGANWLELDESELVKEMVRLRIPGLHRANLLKHFQGDRNVAFQEMDLAARRAGFERAKRLASAAKNCVVLNSLFLSEPVRVAASCATDKMVTGTFNLEFFQQTQSFHEAVEDLHADLSKLEATMQGELFPKDARG